jgi:hypothetical protein
MTREKSRIYPSSPCTKAHCNLFGLQAWHEAQRQPLQAAQRIVETAFRLAGEFDTPHLLRQRL